MRTQRFSDDRALTTALAEFSSLRSLIATRVQLQIATLTAGFTAIGIISGLALQKGGNPNLELLVPFLSSVVSVIYSELRVRIGHCGRYIRDQLWPYIRSLTDPELTSWEHYSPDQVGVWLLGISGAQAPGFLLLAGVLALIARFQALDGSDGSVLLWIGGAALTLGSAVVAAIVGIHELRDHRANSASIQISPEGTQG